MKYFDGFVAASEKNWNFWSFLDEFVSFIKIFTLWCILSKKWSKFKIWSKLKISNKKRKKVRRKIADDSHSDPKSSHFSLSLLLLWRQFMVVTFTSQKRKKEEKKSCWVKKFLNFSSFVLCHVLGDLDPFLTHNYPPLWWWQ